MNANVADIVKDVRIAMDEIGVNDAEFISGADDTEMDTIIKSKIVEAVRYVHGNADFSFLSPEKTYRNDPSEESSAQAKEEGGDEGEEGTTSEDTVDMKIDNNFVGSIVLPDKFFRLVYAKCGSWPVFLQTPIYWNDPEYATLSDEYATGTYERPKIAEIYNEENKRELHLYKAKDGKDTFSVGVLLEPEISGNTIFISDKLYNAVVYYTTGLVLLTYNEQRADNFFNLALTHMGIKTV